MNYKWISLFFFNFINTNCISKNYISKSKNHVKNIYERFSTRTLELLEIYEEKDINSMDPVELKGHLDFLQQRMIFRLSELLLTEDMEEEERNNLIEIINFLSKNWNNNFIIYEFLNYNNGHISELELIDNIMNEIDSRLIILQHRLSPASLYFNLILIGRFLLGEVKKKSFNVKSLQKLAITTLKFYKKLDEILLYMNRRTVLLSSVKAEQSSMMFVKP